MKYLMIDISGKVPLYDKNLCEALSEKLKENGGTLEFLSANIDPLLIKCKSKKLLSLIPLKFQNSENIVKRSIKAIEGVFNYIYLFFYLILHHYDVIHFQWLPFLEVSSIEKYFLHLIKLVSKRSKIRLTIHNIYPHNSNEKKQQLYRKRFAMVDEYFDEYIVHLHNTKKIINNEFKIEFPRIKVVPHGIFSLQGPTSNRKHDTFNLLMYGNQSEYKGSDILVNSLKFLDATIRGKIRVKIVGQMTSDFYTLLKTRAEGMNIEIIPNYISDETLYQYIIESDILVFPYRKISQSGALLLALNFKKNIITSNLPTFRETLIGFENDMFFESENEQSLANVIEKFVNDKSFAEKQCEIIESLKNVYSWERLVSLYV